MTELILASQSPRRQKLMRLFSYPLRVEVAQVDEESVSHPDPAVDVVRTAQLKAEAVAPPAGAEPVDAIIIAADTEVALDGELLGKPADEAQAREMLRRLRGRTHQVHSGLALLHADTGELYTAVSTTDVTMRAYSDEEIARYVASGDPLDKAGGYAIQHQEFRPVASLKGCYAGVVGLPLCYLVSGLQQLGLAVSLPVARRSHDYRRCQTCMELFDGGIDRL